MSQGHYYWTIIKINNNKPYGVGGKFPCTRKVTISVRANKHVVEKFKESEIPLSIVVEASMVNFLKMSKNLMTSIFSGGAIGAVTLIASAFKIGNIINSGSNNKEGK